MVGALWAPVLWFRSVAAGWLPAFSVPVASAEDAALSARAAGPGFEAWAPRAAAFAVAGAFEVLVPQVAAFAAPAVAAALELRAVVSAAQAVAAALELRVVVSAARVGAWGDPVEAEAEASAARASVPVAAVPGSCPYLKMHLLRWLAPVLR